MGGACLRPKKSDEDDNRQVSNQNAANPPNAARNYKQREQKPRSTYFPAPESPSQAIKMSCCDYKLVSILYKNLDQLVDDTFDVQNTKIGLGE